MNAFAKFTTLAILGSALTACGGNNISSGGAGQGPSTEAELLARTIDYLTLIDRPDALGPDALGPDALGPSGAITVASASGTASFTGVGLVAVNFDLISETGDAVLMGDAQIDVDFGNGDVDGSITNLFGVDLGENIDEYSGSIDISGGSIGGADHNDISADYVGTISGNDDTIVLSGQMFGTLLGNNSVKAIDMADFGTGTFNGSGASTLVGIVVEAD
ncbi:MAG: hypothetical protein OSA52_04135 [Yoonia sp.]|nr:hypothetical protein [Yoonia sp.]